MRAPALHSCFSGKRDFNTTAKAVRTTDGKELHDFERKSKQRLMKQLAFMSASADVD